MAQKSYYTKHGDSSPAKNTLTASHVAALHRIADSMPSDYESHAKTIRSVANQLSGSKAGKAGVKEHRSNQRGPGQKKTNAAGGG